MERTQLARRWRDWGTLLLGAWLFISPWVMQYPADIPNAALNAHILGLAIVVFSAFAVYMPRTWEEGVNIALGVWTVISPWVLRFASHRDVTTNAVVVGFLVTALAIWAMAHDKSVRKIAA
jgi:hypothetical protein